MIIKTFLDSSVFIVDHHITNIIPTKHVSKRYLDKKYIKPPKFYILDLHFIHVSRITL